MKQLQGGRRNRREEGEEWWSYRCEVFLFFFREEKFRLGKALSLLVALSSLSLFFKFFLRIKEKKRDESVKVTC